ncbi:MAG: hypothetical protein ACD_42C00441G0002 [uncultured bacterium]|nr:MAG: hypothetical protein ACD_42C00441G0002 [uncultured bacterium]OGT33078.1 MAG: hypothetical protein A3C44_05715 [Gammaproteobacteria bacterium RIFCSPHIGHO2_02_FULL_39_13]OGT49340.1 MAG: hypothetical protein A3E53_07825 [Gammaproteobacteria bacterium RIFCSPHIGHO2_12_FULL_39_24]
MNKDKKKVAVLRALQQQSESIQLPTLLKMLGKNFAERSVRRWLNELVAEHRVEKLGQKRGTYYRARIEKKDFVIPVEEPFIFSRDVHTTLSRIHQPVFQRQPITYDRTWVDAYQPNKTAYLTASQTATLQSVGAPEVDATPAGTYARKIYDRLLVELSYHSSRLEGNTYSFGETEKLIMEGESSVGKLDAEKIMILNHKEAIRYLVDNAEKLEINFNTICTLHYLLSEGLVQGKESGKIRDHSVKISSSTYIPMDDQLRLTKQLNHICDIAKKIHDPYEQSFFLLVHIAYLQVFTDVNKRTARLSANIPLIRNNLYPIAFNKISKEDYISAMLAIYELHDVRVLAELYTFSLLYTAREYRVLVDSMGLNEVRIRFRKETRKIVRDIILKKLTGKLLEKYIQKNVRDIIPTAFQSECITVIHEDLMHMGPERIHGLGVTQKELKAWMKLSSI